jgi:hypothetical protein
MNPKLLIGAFHPQERIEIEHTEKKPIFSTHSLTGKKLTSALAHHRGKAHKCTLRVTSSEDIQRTRTSLTRPSAVFSSAYLTFLSANTGWVLALRFASKESVCAARPFPPTAVDVCVCVVCES